MKMYRTILHALGVILALAFPGSLRAAFHFMEISEVMVGAGGDCRIGFIEFQMTFPNQTLVGGHTLCFFDAPGNLVGELVIPSNVANGENGAHILFGTQKFADAVKASGVTPDFILPEGFLMPHGGRISFGGPSLIAAVDSVAYGIYSGDNTGYGSPTVAFSITDGLSLTRTSSTGDNSADFELVAPSPTSNAGVMGEVTPPEPDCYLEDDFDDITNWDQPAANAGLDLQSCVGEEFVADTGEVTVKDGKLLLTPGLVDELGLDNPIAFTGLKNAVALQFSKLEGYRVKFDMRAQPGIVTGAVFVSQHYDFNEGKALLDFSRAAGIGINFSFDSVTEASSDHLHPDVRIECLAELDPEGPSNVPFETFDVMVSDTDYTVTLDVQGDDVDGPLTLAAKLFETQAGEPPGALATWRLETGLGAPIEEDLDHGLFIAALGQRPAALELTNLSVCEIPRNQLFVRDLTCERNFEGTVTVSWENPDGGSGPIAVVLNGTEIARLEGTENTFFLEDVPEEELNFQVINFSCTPVECTLCLNRSPVADIQGPSAATLTDAGTATVVLTSADSSDGDDGSQSLLRQWTIVGQPDGSEASIAFIDSDGVEVEVTSDTEGEYDIELTVSDGGCLGDFFDSLEDTTAHRLSVIPTGTPFKRGDADDNSVLELTDAIRILNFLFLGGEAPSCFDAADADDNGTIELTDAIRILGFLFLGQASPADPLDCGIDPTKDSLTDCVYMNC